MSSKQAIRKNVAVIILAIFVALVTVSSASGIQLGYNVYINGEKVGAFKNESEALSVASYIYEMDSVSVVNDTKIVFGIVDGEFNGVMEAVNNYRKTDSRYEQGVTLFVEGKALCNLKSVEEAKKAIETLLNRFGKGNYVTASFSEKVEIEESYFIKGDFVDSSCALELLSGAVSVETMVKESFYECIPYQEIEVEDKDMYKGERQVASEGISGERYVEYTTVKVNGEEISRYESGETVLRQTVNKVIKVGIKEYPKGMATGSFKNPTEGILSSPYGARWGRTHKGIDIIAPSGTPIYASDGGTVVYSDWMSGYGYLIQIDHGNGYVSYYAHCSALCSKVGDKVAKGDLIAKVGSTGNSTGNHLHFEIVENGNTKNPLDYVNY